VVAVVDEARRGSTEPSAGYEALLVPYSKVFAAARQPSQSRSSSFIADLAPTSRRPRADPAVGRSASDTMQLTPR